MWASVIETWEKARKKSKAEKQYGKYPCNDYLNNALRFLLLCNDDSKYTQLAIEEICYAIKAADGVFADDVREKLTERGFTREFWLYRKVSK